MRVCLLYILLLLPFIDICERAGPRISDEYRKKNPQRPITERRKQNSLFLTTTSKLASDVIGMSFDAQLYEVFGYRHGRSVGCVTPELRGLGWSSTENNVIIAAAVKPRGFRMTMCTQA